MRRTATGPDDLPTMADILALSGLEFMQGMLAGTIPGPPIAQPMHYALTRVAEGVAEFRGTPQFECANPMGSLHGGWYGTLLDSAMACAVMTRVPRGSVYTTLEYKVNILRAIPLGMEIACVGICLHAGRSTGVASGEIRGVADGKPYATGSTTCLIMAMSPG